MNIGITVDIYFLFIYLFIFFYILACSAISIHGASDGQPNPLVAQAGFFYLSDTSDWRFMLLTCVYQCRYLGLGRVNGQHVGILRPLSDNRKFNSCHI